MSAFTRRNFIGTAAAAIGSVAALQKVVGADRSKSDPGPANRALDGQNPDSIWPPSTDSKSLVQNFKYPFSFANKRTYEGGWSREVTVVHVAPLQPFQLAASCSGIQAKNRCKVCRFPFRPHYSRFEKPLLFFLSDCPPDGWLFEEPYIVSNTCPKLRSLQDAARDAQLCVERGGANFLFRPPCPVIGDPLHSDDLERFLFEVR